MSVIEKLSQLQREVIALTAQAKRWREVAASLEKVRTKNTELTPRLGLIVSSYGRFAGRVEHNAWECGHNTALAIEAMEAVGKDVFHDFVRAAEVHACEQARRCFMRACLVQSRLDSALAASADVLGGEAGAKAEEGAA